ncbi:putative DNA binding protein [Pseudohyphozyma bogoriensis]|nr:putative DNA binding protein [Pseudohyphozyma bogoriensis]
MSLPFLNEAMFSSPILPSKEASSSPPSAPSADVAPAPPPSSSSAEHLAPTPHFDAFPSPYPQLTSSYDSHDPSTARARIGRRQSIATTQPATMSPSPYLSFPTTNPASAQSHPHLGARRNSEPHVSARYEPYWGHRGASSSSGSASSSRSSHQHGHRHVKSTSSSLDTHPETVSPADTTSYSPVSTSPASAPGSPQRRPKKAPSLAPFVTGLPRGSPGSERPEVKDAGAGAGADEAGPLVTSTLWEEELTVCFLVVILRDGEDGRGAKQHCVARRADNGMVNGTKLLNVCGEALTRGRRDSLLKAVPERVVVTHGTIHLKGVWIPLAKAQSLARVNNIEHLLTPLFESDIIPHLYSSRNRARTSQLIVAARQRDQQLQQDALKEAASSGIGPLADTSEQAEKRAALKDLLQSIEKGVGETKGEVHAEVLNEGLTESPIADTAIPLPPVRPAKDVSHFSTYSFGAPSSSTSSFSRATNALASDSASTAFGRRHSYPTSFTHVPVLESAFFPRGSVDSGLQTVRPTSSGEQSQLFGSPRAHFPIHENVETHFQPVSLAPDTINGAPVTAEDSNTYAAISPPPSGELTGPASHHVDISHGGSLLPTLPINAPPSSLSTPEFNPYFFSHLHGGPESRTYGFNVSAGFLPAEPPVEDQPQPWFAGPPFSSSSFEPTKPFVYTLPDDVDLPTLSTMELPRVANVEPYWGPTSLGNESDSDRSSSEYIQIRS